MLDYVTVTGGVMTDEEIQAYVDHVQEKNPQRKLKALNLSLIHIWHLAAKNRG